MQPSLIDELEPLYGVDVVCELVPISSNYLNVLSIRLKFEPRYSTENGQRLYTRSEVIILRERILSNQRMVREVHIQDRTGVKKKRKYPMLDKPPVDWMLSP